MTPAPGLDPDRVAAATLASLPEITPARLDALLSRWTDPVEALEAVMAGRGGEAVDWPGPGALWMAGVDPARVAAALSRRRTHVLLASDPGFPIPDEVPHRPVVLLAEGDRPDALDAPRVAVVGTRAATPHGLADARELGAFLASAGVCVVSGLAIGIDGAAHLGALAAAGPGAGAPVGVVATGLDIVYPRRHGALFERVRRAGLLVGEHGFGVPPVPGRFPVRNRIIAALADVVVVVEATARGGARITAERALDYGRPVLAMPGSRRNPAAAGCNALLADGAQPLLDPSDVLVALGITPGGRRGWSKPKRRPMSPEAARVERALGGEPAHPDQLGARSGLSPEQVAVALEELTELGLIERTRGFVWPR